MTNDGTTRLTRVICNQIVHPVIPYFPHCRALCIQISQRDQAISEIAIFHLPLIIIVVDGAVGVEVRC
jgi:hypothetical protein